MSSDLRTNKAGRPSVINEEIIRKLEITIASGMSISASCHFSGVSTSTFYEHKALDKEFADRMRWAEEYATFRARQVILQAIDNGDISCAKFWLERKSRLEFAPPKAM
ncbi:MAG TPA: hypothetical protein VLG16_04055 [Candidatus Saccharimonadales bacterium]|nr:hypothetical protein [Candidatus Saccharimonadales bacterium]